MNYESARDAVVGHLQTNWSTAYPSVPVFYENQDTPALDTVGNAFLRVELSFDDADQASLEGASPMTRVHGLFDITVMSKQGTGTKTGLSYLDFLVGLFKHRNLSGLQVGTPKPGHRELHDGWHMQQLLVPFWFNN